jgi:hypothetical protein
MLFTIGQVWAAASLKLGAVLPAWSEVRTGALHGAATRLVEDYSSQVRHFCVIPEVFLLPSATSIQGGRDAYEAFLPTASRQRLLVDASDQRVTMIVTPVTGQEVMAVLAMTASGVLLILC